MEDNKNVDTTGVVDAQEQELFQSAYDRSSSDGNYEKKTEERVSENQQRNDLDEESLGRSISRQEERQSSQASSIRLTSEQKKQEISNLKRQWMLPTPKEKMAKSIEDLKEQNKALRQELDNHESNSQTLLTQLAEKQDIIAILSKRIQHFESLVSGEVQDMKNCNKRITEQLLSDLQKAVTMQTEKAQERRARIQKDYVGKEDYRRLIGQKLEIEQELKELKQKYQEISNRSSLLQTNYSILKRQNDENLEVIALLRKNLGLKDEEKQKMTAKLWQKQAQFEALSKHLQSGDTRIASQNLQIEQYQAQIENLKTLNTQLYQKCTNILSQTNDNIFLQFSGEITAFTEQLQKLNEENKYVKEQFVNLKTIEIDNDRERMTKDIELTFSRQKISLCQAVIKEKQDQAAETANTAESLLKMKNEELDALENNIKHLEKIIQDTTTFYTTLLSSKQAEWKILNQINDEKTKALEIIIYIREQTIKELSNKLIKIESDHTQQIKKQRQEYKQQLSKSENNEMQLQLELDQMKQKAGLNQEEKERLSRQNGLMISLVKLIEKNQENVKNILAEIESINKDHVFDGIAAAFFSLSEKLENNELQIKNHQQALKKMKEQLQQNTAQFQSEQRVRQSSLQEKESQLQSLTNQLKQKAKVIQQFQEKVNISSKNDTLVKQFSSKIESYITQINEKNKLIQSLQEEKSQLHATIENQSIQIQGYRSESSIYQYKIEDLQNHIKQLSRKNESLNLPTLKSAPSQDKELQMLKKKYGQLQEELNSVNELNTAYMHMEETYKSNIADLEKQVIYLGQKLKKSSKTAQIQDKEKSKPAVDGTCCLFTARSMIEGSKGGKQFVVRSVEQYCSREVKAVEMVFRKDENNNNSFHSSFRPVDLAESICLFLLKRADVVFGIATFPEAFKGAPSAFLLSVTNEKCVFKAQEGFDQAFAYELNAITFGKKEIKIKSGFKNVTISDVIFKGYFESYVKRQVFGPEFKEVSEFDNFEIHKIHV